MHTGVTESRGGLNGGPAWTRYLVMMHNFWAVKDPMTAQVQEGFFIANLSRIGAALFIAYFGAGPLSLDARGRPEGRKAL